MLTRRVPRTRTDALGENRPVTTDGWHACLMVYVTVIDLLALQLLLATE